MPERPPIVNTPMKPSAQSIGVSNEMFPRQSVASQLKIFTPVGTAITIELSMKKMSRPIGIPTANMWCPRRAARGTRSPTVEMATAL